jgi:hypothetical protein
LHRRMLGLDENWDIWGQTPGLSPYKYIFLLFVHPGWTRIITEYKPQKSHAIIEMAWLSFTFKADLVLE